MAKLSACALLFAVLVLPGCGLPQSYSDMDKTPEARYLREMVDRLAAHDYAVLESRMDERVHQADIHGAMERLASLLPAGAPIKTQTVAWNFVRRVTNENSPPAARTANVAIEYTYSGSKWVLATAALSGEEGSFRIVALNLQPLSKPLEELNAFTFEDRSPVHYLFLVLAAISVATSLYAFVRCIRTKGLKRKWLWAAFTLVGLVAFSLNWTTGELSFQVLRFGLPSATMSRFATVGPWFVVVFIPFGAIVFLWKKRKAELEPVAPEALPPA